MAHGASSEPIELDCSIGDEELYKLYQYLVDEGYDFRDEDEEAELNDDEIERHFPEIYKSLLSQVEDDAEDQGYEGDNLRFKLLINHQMLEDTLGSNPDAGECW